MSRLAWVAALAANLLKLASKESSIISAPTWKAAAVCGNKWDIKVCIPRAFRSQSKRCYSEPLSDSLGREIDCSLGPRSDSESM